MIPGLMVNPEATREQTEGAIECLLSEARAAIDIVTDYLGERDTSSDDEAARATQLAYTVQNTLGAIDELWNHLTREIAAVELRGGAS